MDTMEMTMALIAFKASNDPHWWIKNTRRGATGEIFVSTAFVYRFADAFNFDRDDVNAYFIDAALERLEPKTLKGEAHDDHSSPNK